LLVTKKDELRKYEESLHHRAQELNEREEQIVAHEATLAEREEACRVKEEAAGETQKRLNHAAETLRAQWEKLREDKAGMGIGQEPLGELLQSHQAGRVADLSAIRRPSMPPVRPTLEERA
jgi:NIMA (never in mitosis gene a)-related kinase